MTDAERQKLCEWLRGSSVGWSGSSKLSQAAAELFRTNASNELSGFESRDASMMSVL
jgi:hypothetical protein